MNTFDLLFPYRSHDFDFSDCLLDSLERLESQHRFYVFLYESMILDNRKWGG
jgi:hypothetical protein